MIETMESELLAKISRQFETIIDSKLALMRRQLEDFLADVNEELYVENGTVCIVRPQSENWERIDQVVAYAGVPAGNMGLVELGSEVKFPVPPGVLFAFTPRKRLQVADLRVLSSVTAANNAPTGTRGSGAAGYLFLGLYGKEVSTTLTKL